MTDFNEWLASGTIKRREVPLYANAAIMDEMEALKDRIGKAEAEEARESEAGDRTMSQASELPALYAEAEALWERYEASKAVWHVRAVTPKERDKALDAHPAPDAPLMPRGDVPEAVKRAWEKERDAWKKAEQLAEVERRLFLLSLAVEKIETAQGEIPGVTVEQLRTMLESTYGPQRVNLLWKNVDEAGKVGEAPAPFSRKDSETTPD